MSSSLPIIISAVFVGLAAGYLGSFMVLRRMALVGDALSHVALPGVALGLLLHFNPFLGAFATLFIGITCIWLIEQKTRLSTESLVGLFFTISLAIGLLITPQPDLLEALFGDLTTITRLDMLVAIVLSLTVVIITARLARSLMLGILSDDLARANGISTKKINFIYLVLVAVIVALGLKVVGTFLMGALVVIPAITAKNVTRNLRAYAWGSAIAGLVSTVIGIVLAQHFSLAPGPIIVLTSGALFVLSLFFSN